MAKMVKKKVVLTSFVQTSEENYTHIFKTVTVEYPDDGRDWHVCGEEQEDNESAVGEDSTSDLYVIRRLSPDDTWEYLYWYGALQEYDWIPAKDFSLIYKLQVLVLDHPFLFLSESVALQWYQKYSGTDGTSVDIVPVSKIDELKEKVND